MRSMRVFIPVALSVLWLPPTAAAEVGEDFEKAAKELPFFALDDFLYDRKLMARVRPAEADEYNEIVAHLL